MQRVYLLTGKPGAGKTTLIKEVLAEFQGKAGGFYTEEIRGQGRRLGFKLITLDGQEAILAHTDFTKQYRVGQYGVDIQSLDRVGVSALQQAVNHSEVIIIDEIGKMELLSANFRKAISGAVGSGKQVLGTIMLNANPWADEIKRQPPVKLVMVTRGNHLQVLSELRRWLISG